MANKKVLRFILPSRQLEGITSYVTNYYSQTWSIDAIELKGKVQKRLNRLPDDVLQDFEQRPGNLLFLVDHEKEQLNIDFRFSDEI